MDIPNERPRHETGQAQKLMRMLSFLYMTWKDNKSDHPSLAGSYTRTVYAIAAFLMDTELDLNCMSIGVFYIAVFQQELQSVLATLEVGWIFTQFLSSFHFNSPASTPIASYITPLPRHRLPPLLLPIQPTPMINTHLLGIIPRLHSHLRRRLGPHTSLTVKHNLLLRLRIRLRISEARLEFVRGEVDRVRLRDDGDVDGARDDAGALELGGFAHVDENYGVVGWGGGCGWEGGGYLVGDVSLDAVVAGKVGGGWVSGGDDGCESGPGLRLQSPIAGMWGRRSRRWSSGLAGGR